MRIVREGRWVRSPARNEDSRDVKFGEVKKEGGEEERMDVCVSCASACICS